VYCGFFALGCGWGGMIPLQEVIWASFFGRRFLGAVRSAGLPFSLVLGASAPLLVSLYFDKVGNYDGAFFAIAGVNLIAAAMILLIPNVRRQPPTSVCPPQPAPAADLPSRADSFNVSSLPAGWREMTAAFACGCTTFGGVPEPEREGDPPRPPERPDATSAGWGARGHL
jgi:hypothetical protein